MVIPAGAFELLGKEGLTLARTSGDLGLIFFYSFFYIGLIEEGFKFLLLALAVNYRKDMNEPVDGIIYGITVGLGFAALENLLNTRTMGFEVGLWRAVVTCLLCDLFGLGRLLFDGRTTRPLCTAAIFPRLWSGPVLARFI